MAGILGGHSARFLFRDDKGSIDRRTWWLTTLALAVALIAMALLVTALDRAMPSTPDEAQAIIDAAAQESHSYLSVLYNSLLFLIDVCYVVMVVISVCAYFVGAKRYNDLGKPPQLALILPAAIYFQIFSPILSDQLLPVYGRWVAALFVLALVAWQVWEMGFKKGRL